MYVSVIGAGYSRLMVGACVAESGNDVMCADINASFAPLRRSSAWQASSRSPRGEP
jgi:UDP-glucose 6-dehydrogenase